ncbi:NADPH:quinone reductase [Asanoa ishikariensis]|uniref:NADPH:quinone reductase n=2 Tax=Asanoa ishikariensis TaxID=137265 RepID=A0A1H3TH02_9ACTN|nr:NADPH:quinone reductase [Asanoa ishikariensis]SDZ49592.1 NADPH:quinone reductase [Asanoa ishikariensis]
MRIHGYGGPDVIVADEVPRPVPGDGELLVRVAATAFNPSEVGLRRGLLREVLPIGFPYTLGWDVSGTVVSAGAGFAAGNPVVGRLDAGGAAADYVVAPAGALVGLPPGVPVAAAAALPVAGLTAMQAVADLRAGQRVLVNGAGGAVGWFAVQLAKRAGAHVVATASARTAATVARSGADEIIDHTTTPLDGVGADVLLHLAPAAAPVGAVRPGGAIVSATGPVVAPPSVRSTHFVVAADPRRLAELVALVAAGELRIEIAATRPLTDLPAVHQDAEGDRLRGKVLLVPA